MDQASCYGPEHWRLVKISGTSDIVVTISARVEQHIKQQQEASCGKVLTGLWCSCEIGYFRQDTEYLKRYDMLNVSGLLLCLHDPFRLYVWTSGHGQLLLGPSPLENKTHWLVAVCMCWQYPNLTCRSYLQQTTKTVTEIVVIDDWHWLNIEDVVRTRFLPFESSLGVAFGHFGSS